MSEPTLYRLRIDLCDCDHCDLIRSVLVPVETDYEAAERQQKHTPNDTRRIVDAAYGIGGDDETTHEAGCTLRGNHAGDCCVNPAEIGGDDD